MKFKYATMAAAMLAATGASAADLGRPAPAAVDYVKVCDAYGTGFFYIPGTETCLKIDGYVRADYRWQDTTPYLRNSTTGNNVVPGARLWFGGLGNLGNTGGPQGERNRNDIYFRARALLHFDARTNTEFGLLRSYIEAYWTLNTGNGGSDVPTTLDQAFVQFGGLTAGRAQSFFDFNTGLAYGMNYHSMWADAKVNLLAYTFSFGNGISASLSLEDPTTASANRRRDGNNVFRFANGQFGYGYQGFKYPDIVGQLRISQAWGSAQLMAVAHSLYGQSLGTGFVPARVRNSDDWGYAVGAGVQVNLPMIAPGDLVFLQGFYGDGAIGYVANNFFRYGNIGTDANVTGRGSLKTTEAWSLSAGFKHNFSAQWEVNLDGGYGSVDGFGANDFDQYEIAADVRWKPVAGLQIGLAAEYRNVDFTNATRRTYSPNPISLRDNDSFLLGLRVQRNF